jgi:hypothetical protein
MESANMSLPQTPEDFDHFCSKVMMNNLCVGSINCSQADADKDVSWSLQNAMARAGAYAYLCSPDVRAVLQNSSCARNAIIEAPSRCSAMVPSTNDISPCGYYKEMISCVAVWTEIACGLDISPVISTYYMESIGAFIITNNCLGGENSTDCTKQNLDRCSALEPRIIYTPMESANMSLPQTPQDFVDFCRYPLL